MHEALTLAREVSHPLSVAFALSFAAVLHQCRREGHFTAERAAEVRTLADEQGFALFGAWGMYMQGWALAEQGRGEEGRTQIQQGIATYRATGAELARPYQLMLLADAYQRGKQPEAGLSVLTEALAVSDRTGERIWEAELYRLTGELTLQQASNEPGAKSAEQESVPPHPQGHILKPDAHGEAEAYFCNALTIARQQQAKSPELRAATSLARLWQQQGKQAEAHDMLSEIYGWFTEGFDTKDLREAKALLEEVRR
jgi:predicted ATPase